MTFRIYVRALISNPQGEILMVLKQSNQSIAGGKWLLPGGVVEFGETPADALARELREEANFIIMDHAILATETIMLNGVHWLGLYYRTNGETEAISNLEPEKHLRLEWCSVEFAKENLSAEVSGILSEAHKS